MPKAMTMRSTGIALGLAVLLCGAAVAGAPDPAAVKAVFAEARQVSDSDGGKLWGVPLYGPMMFIDPDSKSIVANEADGEGTLTAGNGVYAGTLPPDLLPANTAIEWHGKRWTMLEWPLWGDSLAHKKLLAHELFHRIQPGLHLQIPDSQNPQLDTLEGRLWLQLEWRALATALESGGKAQQQAIRDALAFRAYRHSLFAGSAESERVMEINEGLAEYTGVRLSSPDEASARWLAVRKLVAADEKTWVRSFPYTSGPAYGLLLDVYAPGWRRKLNGGSDLAAMLEAAVPKGAASDAKVRAALYGEAALRLSESERAAENEAVKARYRAKLVDGPVLVLPNLGDKFRVSFDPRELVPLDEAGTVYPTMRVSDVWGALVAGEGVLMPVNYSRVTVAAPADAKGTHLAGPGWTLDLAPGWHLVPADKPGSFTVKKD